MNKGRVDLGFDKSSNRRTRSRYSRKNKKNQRKK